MAFIFQTFLCMLLIHHIKFDLIYYKNVETLISQCEDYILIILHIYISVTPYTKKYFYFVTFVYLILQATP